MAILVKSSDGKSYISSTGLVTNEEKERADKIDRDLSKKINNLERSFLDRKLITKTAVKKDALRIWYEFGLLLYSIAEKYHILGTTDEIYYWQAIYDYVSPLIQKKHPPKKSKDPLSNHFRLCAYMSRMDWGTVKNVGNWSVWRDILDNSLVLYDQRVFNFIVSNIKNKKLGHKEIRPFLHQTRRRLKKIDTKILNDEELTEKLDGLINFLP